MRFLALSILLCALAFPTTSQACDRCACSISGHYLSALPQYQRHVIGTRWFYRNFQTEHHQESFSTEHFHSMELWGRFYPINRLQLLTVIPYNHFTQNLDGNKLIRQGLGDMVFLANYKLLQQNWGAEKQWRQAFYVGGGLKLPTGKFDPDLVDKSVNPNMQPGTGSLDWMASATYTIRYNNWGLNTNSLFRFSRVNDEGYRFGNRVSINGRLFYLARMKSFSLLPSVGISHEWAAKDKDQGMRILETGGHSLFSAAGLDLYIGNVAISAQWDIPVEQRLARGFITAKQRVQLGISYLF